MDHRDVQNDQFVYVEVALALHFLPRPRAMSCVDIMLRVFAVIGIIMLGAQGASQSDIVPEMGFVKRMEVVHNEKPPTAILDNPTPNQIAHGARGDGAAKDAAVGAPKEFLAETVSLEDLPGHPPVENLPGSEAKENLPVHAGPAPAELDSVLNELEHDSTVHSPSGDHTESVHDGYQITTLKGAADFSLFLDQLRIATNQNGKPEHPVIQEFRTVVHRDIALRAKMEHMLSEAYITAHPGTGLARGPQLARSLEEFFELLNAVLTRAPMPAQDGVNDGSSSSLRTFPITALLKYTYHTLQGRVVYRDATFNRMIGKVLQAWNRFLNSPASAYVLNDKDGWLAAPDIDFSLYVHDKSRPHWGFSSFNDFFTRQWVSGVRPPAPGADIAVSAVESHVTRFGHGLKEHQLFCVKGEHYSLVNMLAGRNQLVSAMVGGSLIQAFLAPTSYHRFHAPVAGTVVTADVVPGVYFGDGCPSKNAHDESTHNAQAGYETYLSNVQTRGIVAIQTEQHGLVVVIPIGMNEVSSVKMLVKPGDHVEKGQQLGMFQFGGSTCVVMFQKGVVTDFTNVNGAKYQPGDRLKIGQHMAILSNIS